MLRLIGTSTPTVQIVSLAVRFTRALRVWNVFTALRIFISNKAPRTLDAIFIAEVFVKGKNSMTAYTNNPYKLYFISVFSYPHIVKNCPLGDATQSKAHAAVKTRKMGNAEI